MVFAYLVSATMHFDRHKPLHPHSAHAHNVNNTTLDEPFSLDYGNER